MGWTSIRKLKMGQLFKGYFCITFWSSRKGRCRKSSNYIFSQCCQCTKCPQSTSTLLTPYSPRYRRDQCSRSAGQMWGLTPIIQEMTTYFHSCHDVHFTRLIIVLWCEAFFFFSPPPLFPTWRDWHQPATLTHRLSNKRQSKTESSKELNTLC